MFTCELNHGCYEISEIIYNDAFNAVHHSNIILPIVLSFDSLCILYIPDIDTKILQ